MDPLSLRPQMPVQRSAPTAAPKPADLKLNYDDGVDTLLEAALLPGVDAIFSNSMTGGMLGALPTRFQGDISQDGQAGTQSLEAEKLGNQTTNFTGDGPVRVESQTTLEDGSQVQRGQVGEFQFESRSGFDSQTGVFYNEGFIVRDMSGEQLDFRREIRPRADRSGVDFQGHIGGLEERGSMQADSQGLHVERQVGEYHIAGRVSLQTPTPPGL